MTLDNAARGREQGIALVLVLIFTVLVYVLIAELVTTAQMSRMTGENDVLAARMRQDQEFRLFEIEQMLEDDLNAAAAQSGGEGGMPMAPGPGGPGAEGGEEGEPKADSSRDTWFQPTPYSDAELTTYVWVEDENRKLNLLTLVSPDEKFAKESRDRFVRLIDLLRDGTDFDLSVGDGEQLANAIVEWLRGVGRTDDVPRPPLKSDPKDRSSDVTIPLHLDDLLFVRGITPELYFDQFQYDLDTGEPELVAGLESVLTVYTSLGLDPGDPEKVARQKQQQRTNLPPSSGAPNSGANPGTGGAPGSGNSGGAPGTGNQGTGNQGPGAKPGEGDEAPAIVGLGPRINVNTATRPMLRALLPTNQIPDSVIEAILRYRNEEEPEEETEGEAGGDELGSGRQAQLSNPSGVNEGERPKLKIFETPADLEKIPEFQNIASAENKQAFLDLLTTQSDVFSIHMASLVKRDEKNRVFVLRRARSVVVRIESGEDTILYPLLRLEPRQGIRVFPYDFPEEQLERERLAAFDIDSYALGEKEWNPFFLNFYRKLDARR